VQGGRSCDHGRIAELGRNILSLAEGRTQRTVVHVCEGKTVMYRNPIFEAYAGAMIALGGPMMFMLLPRLALAAMTPSPEDLRIGPRSAGGR
jgi:hypothetical protein